MNLTYLGTAAAEGWPAVFCNCEYCAQARKAGGRNLRTRSQALVNGDLLIDFPVDTYAHMLKNDFDLSAVKYCIVTHSHIDHFVPIDLLFRMESCYAHGMTAPRFDLYGNEAVLERYRHFVIDIHEEFGSQPIGAHLVRAFEHFNVGDYEITPLKAYHAEGENAFVYMIKSEGKTLLYLHDTGFLPEESIKYLAERKIRADLISYDCTYVALASGGGHMGLDSVPLLRKRFEELGISDGATISVVNHFSHNGMLIHDELEPVAKNLGFIAAYDGMSLEF